MSESSIATARCIVWHPYLAVCQFCVVGHGIFDSIGTAETWMRHQDVFASGKKRVVCRLCLLHRY
jgi:hypothetical protein